MESMFKSSFRSFLDTSYIDFVEYGNTFVFPDYEFQVQLVPAGHSAQEDNQPLPDIVYLYEDRWWGAKEMVQERILARLERFTSVFARKCKVLSGRGNAAMPDIVSDFLRKHHTYSTAKCRYRYALEYEGQIVAVATFSEGRPMVRKIDEPLMNVPKEEQEDASILIFDSYEWIRYASLPGVRVVGGMGRLLKAFIEERYSRIEPGTPLEVMTYSDTEWGNGEVYEKELLAGALPSDFYTIENLGSRKFLLQLL